MSARQQWNHACFGVRGVSKRTGSNPVHGPSADTSPVHVDGLGVEVQNISGHNVQEVTVMRHHK
ncbi:hypothetical protein E2C01_002055 [Portunus trituberculatus]|uniref:Uncharacterized protein n=1 Tax=Portunus trituberculatus TaxID=210409 RepID=A0A5B7CPC1_PORTR|nr:hypothetical protein [Portunus trituberculatus]